MFKKIVLAAVAASQGARLHHVKAHGALYNMAAKRPELAQAIARAVYDIDSSLVFYGLASSELTRAGEQCGLKVAHEVFGDRTYQNDGSLTPRKQADAMIEDATVSIRQVLRMITEGRITSVQGDEVPVKADTLCLHGDQPDAVAFAKSIRLALHEAGVQVRAS